MKRRPANHRARSGRYLVATILSLSAARADQISVNYDNPVGGTSAIGPAEVAGFVPAANWNNVSVTSPAANSLVDNSGNVTALGATLSIGTFQGWNTGGNPSQRLFGDKMTLGSAPQTLTLTNVPYEDYDVLVYLSDWGDEVVTCSLDGGTTIAATVSNTFNPIFSSDPFVENNTYAHLRGLSGNVTITMDAMVGELHIAGFQIVEAAPDDTDLDGLPDTWELSWPTVADLTDLNGIKTGPGPGFDTGDYDGDYDTDLEEFVAGTDPTDPDDLVDADNDGLGDGWERFHAGNLTDLTGLVSGPGPGAGSGDFDGDGFSDVDEFLAGSNPSNAASTPLDLDGDGLPDDWEALHFFEITTYNGLDDPDLDFSTNAAEFGAGTDPIDPFDFVDTDADGLSDGWEILFTGNLTSLDGLLSGPGPGAGTGDFDNDGFSDLAEFTARTNPMNGFITPLDIDGDGLPDSWEISNFGSITFYTGLSDPDLDFSNNIAEYLGGTNPLDPLDFVDTDNDGLSDGWETLFAGDLTSLTGLTSGPGPGEDSGDFDGDGYSDIEEFNVRSNPTNAAVTPVDMDGDGLLDNWEIANFGSITAQVGTGDPDGDFCDNIVEQAAGTDPNNADSFPDTDGDGLSDGYELLFAGNLTDLNGTLAAGNGPGAGTGDFDGDGYSDQQEFRYGSNAASTASTPTPVISGNYAVIASTTPSFGSNDVAGAFPVNRWNNLLTPNVASGLVDSGNFSTTLSVTVSNGVIDSWNTQGSLNNRLFGDKLVMGSGARAITFDNVPYGKYDVYLYLSSWGFETVEFSVNGGPVVATLVNSVNPNTVTPGNEMIIQDTYVKLENITGSSVTINMSATAEEVHVAAFQIVQVEPIGASGSFSEWIATFPGVGLVNGFDDDADGDGVPNGLENVFGTDPSAFSQGVAGMTAVAPGTLRFEHPQNETQASNVTATYSWSTDLANWHADGATAGGSTVVFEPSPETPSTGTTTVYAMVSGSIPTKFFVRVVATLNP